MKVSQLMQKDVSPSAPMQLRKRVCTLLGFLGVELDQAANETTSGDGEIAATDSQVRVVVVASREDLVIARAVRQTLAAAPAH